MNKCNTKNNFPKMYICKYGLFFEGQRLAEYCQNSGSFYYINDVILEKFITHYINYLPRLYFRFNIVGTKKRYTLPVNRLGIFFKSKNSNLASKSSIKTQVEHQSLAKKFF